MRVLFSIIFFNILFAFNESIVLMAQNDLSRCMVENAMSFVNVPYKSATLDASNEEILVCRNDGFDCVTLVEYVAALSMYQLKDKKSPSTFEQFLTQIRYRNGVIDGYGSRLHYFTEWIDQQQHLGWCHDITHEIGGIAYTKHINFMSKNKGKYPRLKGTKIESEIESAENHCNSLTRYYIPKVDLPHCEMEILNGDIIAITTTIDGLDIVHVGLAYKQGKKLHLLHASQKLGKVSISKVSLYEYLTSNPNQSGIVVIRPKRPILLSR
ncbi:MAG: DUF1460 domain-containing protein [Saprospiraceae bacterium]